MHRLVKDFFKTVKYMTILLLGIIIGVVYQQKITRLLTGSYLVGIFAIDTSAAISTTPAEYKNIAEPFWQAWSLLEHNHYNAPFNQALMIQKAIKGLTTVTQDPYTRYLNPAERELADAELSGEYVGIGVFIDVSKSHPIITEVMPDSPAISAGIQKGDVIVTVNGKNIGDLDSFAIISMVRGKQNTKVTLGILRDKLTQPIAIIVERKRIERPMLSSKWLDNKIYYIKLNQFGIGVAKNMHDSLQKILVENPQGIIVDVRGNPGGIRKEVLDIGSEFIGSGELMIEQYADKKQVIHYASSGGIALNIPLAVLVDAGSASASEVFAAAIQDHKRGKIIGTKTYGKGSVQAGFNLKDDFGRVMISYALWLTPNKKSISKHGVTPDIEVKPSKKVDTDQAIMIAQQVINTAQK